MDLLTIKNLRYDNLNLSLNVKKGDIYFIIGENKCGKTTLLKICSGDIITNNSLYLEGKILKNKDNYQNINMVERVSNNSFYYKKVLDELLFPLLKKGYSKDSSINLIKEYLGRFDLLRIIDKNISNLNIYEKQVLLIIISLLNKPKLLLMDNPLGILKSDDAIKIMNILKKLCDDYLTVIYFSNNLNYSSFASRILLLNKDGCIGEFTYQDIFDNDKVFYDNNIEIPLMTDLCIKLKMYNLISKNYDDIKSLVDDIWD